MNRKQLILVLLALAIVGSAGLVLFKQRQDSWSHLGAKMGDKVLPHFHPNDVVSIHLKGDTEINVVHQNDMWRVPECYDYPANYGKISDTLFKLEGLKIVEAETVGPSQLARVNLDEPGSGKSAGTLVEFKDSQGKVLETILLGKKHFKEQGELTHALVASDPDGRYILLRNDPKTVLLISDALGGLEPKPEAWVSKDFFKAERIKSVALTATNAADSWKISRATESAPWVLADAKPGEVLSAQRAAMIASTLNAPRFVEVAPAANATGTGLDKPTVISIETFDGFAYTLKIGAKGPDDNYHLTVDVAANLPPSPPADHKLQDKLKQERMLSSWVYTVNSWILDAVVRARPQILEGYRDSNASETPNTAAAPAPVKEKPAWTPHVIK